MKDFNFVRKWLKKILLQSQDVMQQNKEWSRTIFTSSPVGLALVDSVTGRIYEVNQKYADRIGFKIEEVKRFHWMQITHPDDIQSDLDNMALMNVGQINDFCIEKRLLHSNGSIIWV